jgi:hypothetical protein
MGSALVGVLDDLAATPPGTLSTGEQVAEIEDLFAAYDQLAGVIASRVAHARRFEVTEDELGVTMRTFLSRRCHRPANEAGLLTRLSYSWDERQLTIRALQAGDISLAHVRMILACLKRLRPCWVDQAEAILVEAATSLPPEDLRDILEAIRAAFGDDSAEEREQRRFDDRWVRTSRSFENMIHIEGMLDPESGATLRAALDAMLATRPADDTRTEGQATADALTDLARIALARRALPDICGDRPHITATVSWEKLSGQLTERTAAAGSITPETARRLACDADIIPVVLGSEGQVLNLGRHTPTWSIHQRRAAAHRDSGCVWPDCTAELGRCQLHHLQHWAKGGPTDIDNSAYLCHFHHWLVHHKRWTISRDAISKRISIQRT